MLRSVTKHLVLRNGSFVDSTLFGEWSMEGVDSVVKRLILAGCALGASASHDVNPATRDVGAHML